MKFWPRFSVLVFALIGSIEPTESAPAAEPIAFTIKFSVGQIDRQTSNTETEFTISGGPLPAPKKASQKTSSTTTVKQIKSDALGTTAEMTYDAVNLSSPLILQADSKDADKAFSALVGKTVTLHFTPAGKVDKIDGIDAILSDMPAGMGAATRQYLTSDRLKEEFNSPILLFLPKKPVQIGETWETEISNAFPDGTQTLNGNVKLVGVEDRGGHRIAKIEFHAKGKFVPAGGGNKQETYKQFDQNGSAEFDLTRGWLIAHSFERRTIREKIYSPPGKAPFTMTLEETLKSSFSIAGEKPESAKNEPAK